MLTRHRQNLERRTPGLPVALAVAVLLCACRGEQREPRFETAKVERGRLVARITATGTVSALVTVQVGSQVSGRIQEILVDFNSEVKKGQLIARIDPQLFQAALEQARANHTAAQANLLRAKVQAADARRQADRARVLVEKKLIAEADFDTAQAQAEAAQAQVDALGGTLAQARATLHQAEINLAYTSIHSPINGIVISRNVDPGQTVAASLQAPTLFTIAEDLRKMQVNTSVAEADVGKLAPGMTAMFRVDAYPNDRFRGTIRQIRNAPQTVQNVVTYDAVIDVDNAELKLRPGMTANVTVIYAEKDEALQVPNAALRFRPSAELLSAGGERKGGQRRGGGRGGERMPAGAPRMAGHDGPSDRRTVWALRDNQPQPVAVRVGVSDGTATEVVEIFEGELREGDVLITDSIGEPSGGNPMRGMRRMF